MPIGSAGGSAALREHKGHKGHKGQKNLINLICVLGVALMLIQRRLSPNPAIASASR
jgi:hypothetical protein